MSQSKPVQRNVLLIAALILLVGVGGAHAASVYIPNASFETPVFRVAPYATANIDNWQKPAVPAWWPDTPENWTNMAGVFYNVPNPTTQIDNLDGEQAAFMYSAPGMGLSQDLAATFEVGQTYTLTAKYQGGGMGMPLGTPLEFRLFYRDGAGNPVTIGVAEVLNTTDETQPHAKHLESVQLQIPAVAVDAPWAGKNIGVECISTASFGAPIGYWRIDDLQLTSVPEPASMLLLLAGLSFLSGRRSRN